MDCDKDLQRYLVFSEKEIPTVNEILKKIGATKIIVRKHSSSEEIDFRVPHNANISELKEKLGNQNILIPVLEDFSGMPIQEMLETAERLISEERFWEAHNVLEDLWKNSAGKSKQVFHDIIGIVVSQIKVQMNQESTGQTVYLRNIAHLKEQRIDLITNQLPEKFSYPIKLKLSELSRYLQ